MKYIIYVRVSTEEQKKGHSLEMQKEICLAHVPTGSDFEIICDSSSGGKNLKKREELQKALNMLNRGDMLLVYKMDRLVRDYIQYGHIMYLIQEKKASVLAVMEKDQDRTMKGFVAVMSDLERQRIKDNTRRALQSRKKAGYRVGHIPYGYTCDKENRILPMDLEQRVLFKIEHWFEEKKSYRQIAECLNKEGTLNRNGSPWSHVSIHKILKNAEAHRRAYLTPENIHQHI